MWWIKDVVDKKMWWIKDVVRQCVISRRFIILKFWNSWFSKLLEGGSWPRWVGVYVHVYAGTPERA